MYQTKSKLCPVFDGCNFNCNQSTEKLENKTQSSYENEDFEILNSINEEIKERRLQNLNRRSKCLSKRFSKISSILKNKTEDLIELARQHGYSKKLLTSLSYFLLAYRLRNQRSVSDRWKVRIEVLKDRLAYFDNNIGDRIEEFKIKAKESYAEFKKERSLISSALDLEGLNRMIIRFCNIANRLTDLELELSDLIDSIDEQEKNENKLLSRFKHTMRFIHLSIKYTILKKDDPSAANFKSDLKYLDDFARVGELY